MQGKTVVITGASAGVGAAAARQMHALGADVVVVGRSPEKTRAVTEELGVPGLVADFARLGEVDRLADELRERCPRIDVLANNAGGLFPRRVVTEDGHELTFQVNHLATFRLTQRLRDRLAGGRVITTSSLANTFGSVRLDDLGFERRRWTSFRAYAASKLMNVLFTAELARRAPELTAVCFHPGNIASDFARDSMGVGLIYRTPLRRVFLVPPEIGGRALTTLAIRDDLRQFNGGYFDRFAEDGRTSRQAKDAERARGLWGVSAAAF